MSIELKFKSILKEKPKIEIEVKSSPKPSEITQEEDEYQWPKLVNGKYIPHIRFKSSVVDAVRKGI